VDAVKRLETFVDDFARLTPAEMTSPAQWRQWVGERVTAGWEARLHFSTLLDNFGFSREMTEGLRHTTHYETQKDGQTKGEKLEHFSFRWLSKALTGFNVKGCLTDVANLAFAMAGEPPDVDEEGRSEVREDEVVARIRKVSAKLADSDFSGLWVPTHFVHDAETDDMLAWLLLQHVHRRLGSSLSTLVQLPAVNESDEADDEYKTKREHHRVLAAIQEEIEAGAKAAGVGVRVFNDPRTANTKAIQLAFPRCGKH
jgi:hypothetical protein